MVSDVTELVKLGRIYGSEWGVYIETPDGGSFRTKDIPDLVREISRRSSEAMRRNTEESQGKGEPLTLVLTCAACPEQYDVLLDGKDIGHLHLRHGYFSARYGGPSGEEVYGASTLGDGVFEQSEREYHLLQAKQALMERHNRESD